MILFLCMWSFELTAAAVGLVERGERCDAWFRGHDGLGLLDSERMAATPGNLLR